jgi:hypothetical protein
MAIKNRFVAGANEAVFVLRRSAKNEPRAARRVPLRAAA